MKTITSKEVEILKDFLSGATIKPFGDYTSFVSDETFGKFKLEITLTDGILYIKPFNSKTGDFTYQESFCRNGFELDTVYKVPRSLKYFIQDLVKVNREFLS